MSSYENYSVNSVNDKQNSKTTEILTEIYESHQNTLFNSDLCRIQSKPICGKIKYLDELPTKVSGGDKQINDQDELNFDLMGGARKKVQPKKQIRKKAVSSETTKEIPIFPSLNDIPDKDIQDFIQETHIQYITANMKSNSIYVIPNSEAMKEIKSDIKKSLEKIKVNTPEAILKIKSDPKLIYRAFIMDIFGSLAENGGYEYRIPITYPDEFNSDTIIRRTSRLEDKCFFIQLNKKGCKISNNSDMKNSVNLEFIDIVGRKPTFISFVFKGNLLPLLKPKEDLKGGKQKKKSKKTVMKRFMELAYSNPYDIDSGMYQFVGEMIDNFGVDVCQKSYSADFLQSAFSLVNSIGKTKYLTNYGHDVYAQHMKMNKKYKPKARNGCNKQNKNKVCDFSKKFINNMNSYLFDVNAIEKSRTCNASKYLNQVFSCYKQLARDLNDNEIKNTIAEDIAYGIYKNTNNIELAINSMQNVIDTFNGKNVINKVHLEGILNASDQSIFHKFNAQEFYPMLNSNHVVNQYCKCGKKNCPFCGSKKMSGGGIYDDIPNEDVHNSIELDIPEDNSEPIQEADIEVSMEHNIEPIQEPVIEQPSEPVTESTPNPTIIRDLMDEM